MNLLGLKVGVVTNNWIDDINLVPVQMLTDVFGYIDVVIESSKVGIRKPDRKIYQLVCRQLGVSPHEVCIYEY